MAAVVVSLTLAATTWRLRHEAGGVPLLALALTSGWWALMQLVGLNLGSFETQLTLSRLEYFGITLAPLAWFWFALEYTGRDQLLRGPLGLVGVVPVLTLVLVFTNDSHGLIWEAVGRAPGSTVPVFEHGWWFTVHAVWAYALVLLATGVLVWHHAQAPQHRSRLAIVVAAPLSVLGVNLLYLFSVQPDRWIDLTPTGFVMACGILVWGLKRQGLLLTAPVARTTVFERMQDAALVLDTHGRIVDLNRAAADMLELEPYGSVPVPLGTVWSRHRPDSQADVSSPPGRVTLPTSSGGERVFEVNITSLGPRKEKGRTVLVLRDVTERVRLERELMETGEALRHANVELERLANTDSLTGLANRRHFMAVLDAEIERSERYGRPLSLISLDLDHFKTVNDTYGHATGDEVLRFIADSMEEVCRDIDLPARIGGEELAILLPETGLEGAEALAERLRERIASRLQRAPDGRTFHVTASLGVATLGPESPDREGLLHEADAALYEAKRSGRDRVVTSSSPAWEREGKEAG